jgi:acetylornithine deacetylase/succinyl-diaminopimelate desuccinylase-like protein
MRHCIHCIRTVFSLYPSRKLLIPMSASWRGRGGSVVGLAILLILLNVPAPAQSDTAKAVRSWHRSHQQLVINELTELLSIPNVASDKENIRKNADLLVRMLGKRGVKARLLEIEGAPPAVYGELLTPGAKRTIVFYAHYDGQPVRAEEWESPPWKPQVRKELVTGDAASAGDPLSSSGRDEERFYARSASDDKSPIVAVLAALDALRANKIPLSVNLKFFLEGEEEAGSPHLAQFFAKYKDLLAADAWMLADGPVHQSRKMQLYLGARGVQDLELTVYGPNRALHSGHYGNWAPNPAVELAHLIAKLRDMEGRILIPGIAEATRPPTEAERKAIATVPAVEDELKKALSLGRTEGRDSLLMSIMRPALNLRGIQSGGVGERASNAVPTHATASIDFRLVPNVTPQLVKTLTEKYLRELGYTIVHDAENEMQRRVNTKLVYLRWGPGYPAARTPMDSPAAQAFSRTVSATLGKPVIVLPTLGGSVPMYMFAELAPVVGVPIVNHDNNQHAANENLRLQNLWDGIEVFAGILAGLGNEWE